MSAPRGAPVGARHMTPEAFRLAGHAAIDWVADYMARVESFPVLARTPPGAVRARLPAGAPRTGESFEAVLADLTDIVLPGITHWQSPSFFAYFPANATGPAILGDLISAGLGVQGMLWATSPACTELETHVLDWLVDMLGLPAAFKSTGAGGGVIQDTASSAALCALLAARERATGFETNERGTGGFDLVAYISSEAHSSIEKAVKIAGLGRRGLHVVAVDDAFAMRPDALSSAIAEDRRAGRLPLFVQATIGTTSSTAIDPVASIGAISRREGLWLHVDAAHAGSAAVCPEFQHFHEGLDMADSYCFNPHKWLLTNFDCDCFFVADRAALIKTLSVLPEYLRNEASASGAVLDYRDWQVPLGRRFRALKLWFVIRYYGVEGLQRHIRAHVALARELAGWVRADAAFELSAPVPLNLVCFRHKAGDAFNQRLMDALNASGRMYLTHTRLGGKFVLRMAIGATHTEHRHVAAAWALIRETAASLNGALNGVGPP